MIGSAVGAIPAATGLGWFSNKSVQGRQHLQTAVARATMSGANVLKGPASDKDTALARMANLSPDKSARENNRILDVAEREGGLAQTRAQLKSQWIGRFGSIGNLSPNGMSFEKALAIAEKDFNDHFRKPASGPRPAPPSTRKGRSAGPVVIDLNGNRIK